MNQITGSPWLMPLYPLIVPALLAIGVASAIIWTAASIVNLVTKR